MPEYDPVNYPKPLTGNLTPEEPTHEPPAKWPSNPALPEQYAGPTPDREFETGSRSLPGTAPLGGPHTDRPVAPVPEPSEPKVEPPISPAPHAP